MYYELCRQPSTFTVFVIILQPTVVWQLNTTTLPPIPAILHITLLAAVVGV